MLIHIPLYIYTTDFLTEHEVKQLIAPLFICIYSYYDSGNNGPLLVTTNSRQILTEIKTFKKNSGFDFNTHFVSEQEIIDVFKYSRWHVLNDNGNTIKKVIPIFYPLLKNLDKHIVHIDYNILFLQKYDFNRLNVKPISFIKNSEVDISILSIQNTALELCKNEIIEYYFNNPPLDDSEDHYKNNPVEYLIKKTISNYNDNFYFEKDNNYNLLTTDISDNESWQNDAKCINYNFMKPLQFHLSDHGINFFTSHEDNQKFFKSFNVQFYKSLIIWYQLLLELNTIMGGYFSILLNDLSNSTITKLMIDNFGIRHYTELNKTNNNKKNAGTVPLREAEEYCDEFTKNKKRNFYYYLHNEYWKFSSVCLNIYCSCEVGYVGKLGWEDKQIALHAGLNTIKFPVSENYTSINFSLEFFKNINVHINAWNSDDKISDIEGNKSIAARFRSPDYIELNNELIVNISESYANSDTLQIKWFYDKKECGNKDTNTFYFDSLGWHEIKLELLDGEESSVYIKEIYVFESVSHDIPITNLNNNDSDVFKLKKENVLLIKNEDQNNPWKPSTVTIELQSMDTSPLSGNIKYLDKSLPIDGWYCSQEYEILPLSDISWRASLMLAEESNVKIKFWYK